MFFSFICSISFFLLYISFFCSLSFPLFFVFFSFLFPLPPPCFSQIIPAHSQGTRKRYLGNGTHGVQVYSDGFCWVRLGFIFLIVYFFSFPMAWVGISFWAFVGFYGYFLLLRREDCSVIKYFISLV